MHVPVTSLSLLCAAIWLTSTASALVARNPILRSRAVTQPEYPSGYNAQSCPLDRQRITLKVLPASAAKAITRAGVPPRASTSSKTKRAIDPLDAAQICREVAQFSFEGADYAEPPGTWGPPERVLTLQTTMMQPGLYVASMKADQRVRGLEIDDKPDPWQHANLARVLNDQVDHIAVTFRLPTQARLKISIRFRTASTVGEISLFKLGPVGYKGPPP